MTELLDGVPQRVLAVYAHPDDPDVSCGGTLARWAGAGSEVHVLICTNGDKGTTDPDVDPDMLARRTKLDEQRQRVHRLAAFSSAARSALTFAGEEDFSRALHASVRVRLGRR